jgi:hypothetical protein
VKVIQVQLFQEQKHRAIVRQDLLVLQGHKALKECKEVKDQQAQWVLIKWVLLDLLGKKVLLVPLVHKALQDLLFHQK